MDIERQIHRDMSNAIEIIPNKLYFVILRNIPRDNDKNTFFTVDDTFVYWNFFLDFGPYNLAQVIKFCDIVNEKLEKEANKKRKIYFYTKVTPKNKCNSIFLMAAYSIIYLDCNPAKAYAPFKNIELPTFHDASPGECLFKLTVLDCLQGLYKALYYRLFDVSTFDIGEYEYYEKVENGDFNWIQADRFLAFAGPEAKEKTSDGYYTLTPSYYIPYFKQHNIKLVVRFNKPLYDAEEFTKHGIRHVDLYYDDGSVPENQLLSRFIQLCEETDGAIAVHCKAGLGRTGTCIGAYLMKHYHFTAEEVIGYIRICRPGSIIGPQQDFLKQNESRLWQEGDDYRKEHDCVPGNVVGGELPLLSDDYHVLLNENSEEEETSENERDSLFNSFTDDMDEMLENIKQKERFSSESSFSSPLKHSEQSSFSSVEQSKTFVPLSPTKRKPSEDKQVDVLRNYQYMTPHKNQRHASEEEIEQGSQLRIQKTPKKELP